MKATSTPPMTAAQEQQYENLLRLLERENVQSPMDLKKLYEKLVKQADSTRTYDEKGNPIIDDEGGCIITPRPCFVIKTKAPLICLTAEVLTNMAK